MPRPIDIRRAAPGDVPALEALCAGIGPVEAGYFRDCLDGPGRTLLLAHMGEALAGYALHNRAPKYRPFARLGIPEVQDLSTHPDHRRRGVASALLDHCEALARAQGCAHIGISVGLAASYGPAQILYARRGYVPDGLGLTYDRAAVPFAALRPADDNLCLMLTKNLFLT